MKTGKLDPKVLEHIIFPYLGKKRREVLVRAEVGEDSSVVDFGGNLAVFSVDPITGAGENMGFLSVNVALNDVVTNGAEPLALMYSMLFPPDTEENDILSIVKEIHNTAENLNVEIIGGHTEVTDGVKFPILTAFAMGKVERENLLTSKGTKPNDAIIITKGVGIEGTAILASTFYKELAQEFGREFVEEAKKYIKKISVIEEALLTRKYANAMHDATEGGIYGGIYELSYAADLGFVIYEDDIPLSPETEKICRYFGINPYFLISSGTLIITTDRENEVLSLLKEKGIYAKKIGIMKADKERYVVKKGKRYEFVPQVRDELWKILERG